MAVAREEIIMRAHSYRARKNIVSGTVTAITHIDVEGENMNGNMLVVDIPTLPGISVMVLVTEVPTELHSVLKQLVGQEIPLLLLKVSGETAYGSYIAALERIRPLPEDGTPVGGMVRAVSFRGLYVEAGNAVHYVPRHLATRSRVQLLTKLYTPGQRVSVAMQNGKVVIPQHNPWENVLFKPGDLVVGTVIDVFMEKGYILIELEPGMKGIAKIPLRGRVERGDRVVAYVAFIDPEKQILQLRVSRKLSRVADRGAW